MSEELRGRPENASRRFDDIFQITSFLHHEARTKPREYWAPIMTTSPSRESVRKRRRRWQSQCKDSGGNRICKRTPMMCSTCTITYCLWWCWCCHWGSICEQQRLCFCQTDSTNNARPRLQCIEMSDATRLRKFVNYEPTCRTQLIMRKALGYGMEQAHQSCFFCVFCVQCVCVLLYVCMRVCVYSCSYLVYVSMLMRARGRICACVSLRVYALARARTCACITLKHFHVRHCRARRNLQSKLPRAAAHEEVFQNVRAVIWDGLRIQ